MNDCTVLNGGDERKNKSKRKCLVRSLRNPKSFKDSLSHRILQHMHEALNIDKNKN